MATVSVVMIACGCSVATGVAEGGHRRLDAGGHEVRPELLPDEPGGADDDVARADPETGGHLLGRGVGRRRTPSVR